MPSRPGRRARCRDPSRPRQREQLRTVALARESYLGQHRRMRFNVLIGVIPLIAWGCTPDCSSSGCPTGECSWIEGNASVCVSECSDSTVFVEREVVCHDSVPTRCSDVPAGQHCYECENCSGDAEYCNLETNNCAPRKAVGETCESWQSEQCASHNCDRDSGVCLVAAGDACTTENCERCVRSGDTTECRQRCQTEVDCDHLRNHYCVSRPREVAYCRPRCSAELTCPDGQECTEVRLDNYGIDDLPTVAYVCYP